MRSSREPHLVLPGAVHHLRAELLRVLLLTAGSAHPGASPALLGGWAGLLGGGAQAAGLSAALEPRLPLLPQPLQAPSVSGRRGGRGGENIHIDGMND